MVTIALTGWRPGVCWGLICAGIVFNPAGNIALVQASEQDAFRRGSPVDTFYLDSALMLGLATWFPIRPTVSRSADDVRSVVAPLLLGSLALGLLLFAAFEAVSAAAILLAAGALALIVARTALAFRDNRTLLEARQRDSLTDGLTGLGNRRHLMSGLEAAMEEARAGGARTLLLFDLDGFKGYNDAFGHPAGDSLLSRLGANLDAAVAPHGRAYRIGGTSSAPSSRPMA
ncbi:MAG: GGDEF domain-containing protein [Actinobacteria bacterium]|nr:GGDEF domain-containing protein [Actinomycetota bacterium]